MVNRETIVKWMREDGGTILRDPMNPGVITGYVTFTPKRAESALENNTRNRTMNRTNSVVLKDVMERGLWDANVSKINFEANGTLSDGQHRLAASVASNVTFRCLVTWGVTRGAQLVTDRRGSRKVADDLAIDRKKNSTNLAAITRMIYMREVNMVDVASMINRGRNTSGVSDVVLYNYFNSNSHAIEETSKMIERIYSSVRFLKINKYTLSVLAYEFNKIHEQDAEGFWRRLASGVFQFEDDPIRLLHKRLFDRAKSNTANIPTSVEAALIIKAWNAYLKGEPVKQLKYTAGGDNPEQFPKIYDPYAE